MSKSSPEIQQIPARHGTATFVPKGQVIKITNTYGRQVVDTWAFALPTPPSREEIEEQNEQEEHNLHSSKQGSEYSQAREDQLLPQDGQADSGAAVSARADHQRDGSEDDAEVITSAGEHRQDDKEIQGSNDDPSIAKKETGSETQTDAEKSAEKDVASASWSSYLPSLPRVRGRSPEAGRQQKQEIETPGTIGDRRKTWSQYLSSARGDERSEDKTKDYSERTWASYFPSGKSFSNYVPKNVSMPAVTSFQLRDPTKSYAEQVYDFSKTPVGAGALSAATGSGYAGTAYAAYQAYLKQQEAGAANPPMEYLSMSHTHAATNRLIPKVGDTLVSNLRQPMLTVVEDTAAVHDTVIAACDPQRYRELGVKEWEKHGSCAENLVLALKQINASVGLKGPKAVGSDVTVNTVPQPLNLFMNIPFDVDGQLSFEAPKGKKGEFIRMRAERDVVVVMSACPQDVLPINGHKCMAAHFVVEEQGDTQTAIPKKQVATKQAASSRIKIPATSAGQSGINKAAPKRQPVKQDAQSKAGQEPDASKPKLPAAEQTSQPTSIEDSSGPTPMVQKQAAPPEPQPRKPQPAPKAGKVRPKKLERRTTPQIGAART